MNKDSKPSNSTKVVSVSSLLTKEELNLSDAPCVRFGSLRPDEIEAAQKLREKFPEQFGPPYTMTEAEKNEMESHKK